MAGPGRVQLRHFDQGVVDTLGATLVELPNRQKAYALAVDGVAGSPSHGGMIPVKIVPVDVAYVPRLLPDIAIRPGEPVPAPERYMPGAKYRWAAPGSKVVTVEQDDVEVSGFSHYAEREAPQPVDLTFEIELRAVTRNDALRMLEHVLMVWPFHGGIVTIADSDGVEKTYEAFNEGTANTSELMSVVERVSGFVLTIRVEAEMDLGRTTTRRAMTDAAVDLSVDTM
jgi:hypothetical protein